MEVGAVAESRFDRGLETALNHVLEIAFHAKRRPSRVEWAAKGSGGAALRTKST
jgi:hypothetical protein